VKAAYEELFLGLTTKKLSLPTKTFDAFTHIKEAVAHATLPGKSEKTLLQFS